MLAFMPEADDALRERITELEVRVAYQDHTIAALDEVVRNLGTRLAATEAALRELRSSVTRPEPTISERPPHY